MSTRSSNSRRRERSHRKSLTGHRRSRSDRRGSSLGHRRSRSGHRRSRSNSCSRHYHSYHRRSSSHRTSSASHHSSPTTNTCWVCGTISIPKKLACRTCFEEATREKKTDAREVTDIIRESIRESILRVSVPVADKPIQSTSAVAPTHRRNQTGKNWRFQ